MNAIVAVLRTEFVNTKGKTGCGKRRKDNPGTAGRKMAER